MTADSNFGPRVETQVFAGGTGKHRKPATPMPTAWALLEGLDGAAQASRLMIDNANLNLALHAMARQLEQARQDVERLVGVNNAVARKYTAETDAHLQTKRALADLEALVPSASRVTRSMRAQRGIDAGEFEDKTVVDDPDAWNDQTPTRDMSKEDGDE